MKLLVIGSGGREHALCWKLAQSEQVSKIFVAPGNAGMEGEPKLYCTGIAAGDFAKIASFARAEGVAFVVVGPDQALADGAVDFLEKSGIAAFGPSREASRIEWSKAYSKDLMRAAKIPTARYETFSAAAAARDFLQEVEWGTGWVVKADGLALGKGVVVCENRELALAAAEEFLSGGSMGEAGKKIVVEERLLGREVSAFFLCDGQNAVPIGMACDYKRIGDGDSGPNTGGMGAYSPADWLGVDFVDRIGREVAMPLLAAMRGEGVPFKGILFIGLMVSAQDIKFQVLEFNARFGDPETQVLLPLLDEDLLPWLKASREGTLGSLPSSGPRLKSLHAVHVVMAAAGYPGAGGQAVRKGDAVAVPEELLPGSASWEEHAVKLFFAGVSRNSGQLQTSGGRVLGLTALGPSRSEARTRAYDWIRQVSFAGSQRRADVGA